MPYARAMYVSKTGKSMKESTEAVHSFASCKKSALQQTARVRTACLLIGCALLERRSFIAFMPIIVVAFAPIIVVAVLMFRGASWIFPSTTDAAHYQCYAVAFWSGSHATNFLHRSQCAFLSTYGSSYPAFRMLPLEYPPLTLLLFSPALLAPLSYYQLVFALCMAIVAV